jgi:RNA polymerase sigma-70 factor (ECF subfamily)
VSDQDGQYEKAAAEFGAPLGRLAHGYESDPEKRRELLQEIHLALWRSFAGFNGACSLRTWVYRVAHNTAASWVAAQRRARSQLLVSLDELDDMPVAPDQNRRMALDRLTEMIQRLKPLDRQVILAWLEGMDAASIGEVTGLSAGNVATKIHRVKNLLARQFQEGGSHAV